MDQHEPLASPRSYLHWDINNLVRELRQERLFVSSEQNELQKLNERVVNESIKLAQSAWVTSQQRLNLNRLILSRPDSSPAICCQKANLLESTRFIDAFKVLPYQDCILYGEFLQNLRASPELLAQCFALGEQICSQQALQVVPSLISGLYGSLVLPHDTVLVLRLLRQLTKLKLISSDNPRRMLRNSSCTFFRLYSEFHEGLFTSKLFLTAALQSPILQLLKDIEYFLDIDPDKAVERFPVEDRIKKFGKEGTQEYNARISKYRKWTINSLEAITTKFINSIKENLYCFPAPLSWLIKQIVNFLTKSGNFNAQEINAMITDLVFTHFICSAMVNPEPYGIIDTPISYISRFNLIQVARIIQMLALMKYQDVDTKVNDLYSLFDKECVSNLLDTILQDASESLEEVPLAIDSVELQGMVRSSALFTEAEIYNLIGFLQMISQALEQTSDEASAIPVTSPATNVGLEMFSVHDREKLTVLLSGIPTRPINGVTQTLSSDSLSKLKRESDEVSSDGSSKKSSILGKGNKMHKVPKPRLNKLSLLNVESHQNINGIIEDQSSALQSSSRPSSSGSDDCHLNHDVLIIPLNVPQGELVGLLPEHKVLSMELSNGFSSSTNLDSVTLTNNVDDFVSEQDSEERDQIVTETAGMVLASGQEKRTRFSHSHDEGSIGNISDNLEAISEAASNHSVASSLELEENEDQNDNDNLSDMISANVSGRGTPNISGRDTPSSQVTEGENDARQMGVEARLQFAPTAQPLINKQIRSEIDDKFCKFEIKKLLEGDETVSIISDTWSTDVLASDSETIEASERDRPSFMPPVVERLERANVVEGLDRLDTVSESAWSTDVLASDSERMTEVDTDDTASVAPSDDTASVARSDDTARSEIEDTPPVQIHRPIPISIPTTSNMNGSLINCGASTSSNHLNNGPVSASSSQPDSPLDIPLPHNYNIYLQNSPHYNGGGSNPNFSPSNAFRPIQEGRDSITPNSPMRTNVNGTPVSSNLTGKGGRKSDYQRRTMEYVDNNANNIHMRTTIERNQIIRSTSEQSTMTTRATETIEHRSSSSILRNSGNSENSSRREAILIDSNSICMNGLELLLEEKERKVISNKTNSTLVRQVSTPNEFPQIPNQKNHNKKIDDICDGVRLSNISLNSTSSSLTSSSSSSETNKKNAKMNGNHSDQWNQTSNNASQTQWYQTTDSMAVSTPSKLQNDLIDLSSDLPSSSSGIDSVLSVTVPKANSSIPTSAIKPQMTSTGAIPKSISFDMTAEKGDKDMMDDDQKNKRGFFGKLKMGFKNRRGKTVRGTDDLSGGRYEGGDGDPPRFKRYTSLDDSSPSLRSAVEESSEDILAKYRRKPSNNSDTNTSDSLSISSKLKSSTDSTAAGSSAISTSGNDERWLIDHNNIENCFAFSDAKRKLRIVLSTASEHSSSWDMNRAQNNNGPPENELVLFLRLQLAKARNLCDWPLVTLINETLRCIALFDLNECRKLLLALRQEHVKRGAYIRYLVRCRQELLATLAHIDSLNTQIISDRKLTTSYLVTVCVRMFLERREPAVLLFCEEFKNLSLADEKTDLLYSFMETLATEMNKDSNWKDASESQLELARTAIERTLISRVYINALFPNGDGDISRDQMLYDHMKKLSKIISPNHKDLRIHSVYHYECPWTSAQNAISAIAAYKTAADKVRCVMRCATVIMNLLSLASERGVPTADDFTPVLVYVLIKANPPSLLSTIQYVNSFYANRLQGEEQYWWIQFCSVVEFIKTMDYSD
ncbi:serine-rich adhesin for platelets isoform X2 [Chrysoperla carnea]|uniref:serine-rich adhesin for platelets isoform X2 n=1 Tax=Chrysoperla carnea TaxID=189513 RepID=UPI001D07C2B5|nr:serine-rich adhesin for platelets isoform X2 [Chrysoperla carnea]